VTLRGSLGDAKSSLGDAKSSLGDAKSSLGDAKSSLGDAKSSLGDVQVSLLSGEAEVQYVALRNILLLTQHLPGLLAADIKVFFCKYNDPIYVKLEKLEVLIALVSDRNIELVLLELKVIPLPSVWLH
jgi:vesicle coat complex subunit